MCKSKKQAKKLRRKESSKYQRKASKNKCKIIWVVHMKESFKEGFLLKKKNVTTSVLILKEMMLRG